MTDEAGPAEIARARALLTDPLPTDPVELIGRLAAASAAIGGALDESMARAALAGVSSRTIAEAAGMAPNSVPPRLARSAALSAYAEGGKVGAEGVAAARFTQRQQSTGSGNFTFTPRRKGTS